MPVHQIFLVQPTKLPTRPRKSAFCPKTGRWILVYSRGTTADGVINLYPSSSSTTPLTTRNLSGGGRRQNFAAYVPATGGWLTGAYTTTQTSYLALKSDLADLNTPATPLVMSGLADVVTGSSHLGLPGASLACPAYTSNPILDLRFEELPGATSFADASLNATNATCTGNSCPAAGFSGVPMHQPLTMLSSSMA